MIRPVPGLSLERIAPDPKHPPWAPPCTIVEAMGLKDPGKEHEEAAQGTEKRIFVLNSLTETMVPFAPRDPRTVRWYTCGPTVYDSAHMGHARAYLTFDILRRIMQDYFNYHVLYQMNVTDLDDKIIRRARINKLMQEYRTRVCGSGSSLVEVVRDIQQARAAARSSLESSKEALDKPLPSTATSRMRDEYEEKLSVWKLKTEMLKESEARIDDAIRCASEEARPTEQGMDCLMDVSSELLGEWLDKHSGHEVKDHAVFEAHARHYEMEFWEDMRALNIQPPDMITRVTEYLPQIIRYIEKIVSNGFAYIASSSVYFDLEAYQKAGHDYPKLKPIQCALDRQTTAAEMEESEGVLGAGPGKADAGAPITASEPGATPGTGKRNPNDFALWKFSKPGEPAWDSPWGPGRPGWHIECSAMASDCLGENMDIHAGGCDLKFPHHDNELAQAEAYWGHGQWVNYFLHAGHLHIRGLKMAKSLKNFVTIRQALREHTADELRMMMILQPWHRPMNYSDQTVGEARERLRTIRSFFATVQNLERDQAYLHHEQRWDTDLEGRLEADITTMHARVDSSLRDNFNTASATEAVLELVSATRRYLKELETCSTSCRTPNVPLVLKASRSIARLLTIFGLRFGSTVSRADPSECTTQSGTCLSERNQTPSLGDTVQALVQFREVVRRLCMSDSPTSERVIEGHILKECDRVRDQVLPCLGIKLEDVVAHRASGPATPLWSFEDPEVLLREQRQRDEKAMAAKKQKVESKLRQKQAEVSKWCEVQSVLCAREGKDGTVADAVPSVREDLSKSAVKKLEKERKAMQALCLEFEAKGGASFLQTLQGEVRILREQLESFGQKED